MNVKLAAIIERAAEDLKAFAREKEAEILSAWALAEEEAQEQESKPKFRLGYAITLDLDADSMETALAWSVRHKVSRDGQIPDPSQGKLPIEDEGSVTISTEGHEPVTMSTSEFSKAAKRLSK